MKTNCIVLFLLIVINLSKLSADEGLWIPAFLGQQRYEKMKELGSKLSLEDIYSINQACLKDAVVLFNGNCTGVVVSNEGLVITNHHCAMGIIQSHSTLEKNYLENGFWAKTKIDELPNSNVKVYFLVHIEDVTDKVLLNVGMHLSENDRASKIKDNINAVLANVADSEHGYSIKPFFKGNQYLLFKYLIFQDVRLVGAPPLSIGKFGGDTDNWVWPRHTGDFSIFRIYAGKDNKPAPYSKENKPYSPVKIAPISLKGIKEGDFTMVLGYPGTTDEYIYSGKAHNLLQNVYPIRISLRSARLNIIDREMKINNTIKLQYANKYAGIANGWKKWEGTLKGLTKANALELFKKREENLISDIKANSILKGYESLFDEYNKANSTYSKYYNLKDLIDESVGAIELMQVTSQFYNIFIYYPPGDTTRIENKIKRFKAYCRGFFKNYSVSIDKSVFSVLTREYCNQIPGEYKTSFLQKESAKYRNNFEKWANELYSTSSFTDTGKLFKLLHPQKWRKLSKDPALAFYVDYNKVIRSISPLLRNSELTIDSIGRVHQNLLLKLDTLKNMYPDANLTFRVAFGKVQGYSPADGIVYNHFTTVNGILEKENPIIDDYKVDEVLKWKVEQKDYGHYVDSTGDMRVCFIASNHTSGGNSGSPVFNSNGELIGLNFDRCWEGTMSDFLFDSNQCRNISLDIRYLLFVVDKIADAGHLVKEMQLVK